MASYMAAEETVVEKIKRVFRDRTSPLDSLTENELISRYRLPRHAIFTLLYNVRPHIEHMTKRSHALSPETQLLLTLRYLSKGGFLMEIGDLHGVHESSVSRSIHRTINAINAVLEIKFNQETSQVRMHDFYKIAGFPRVIGAVDGTLIAIKRPPTDEEGAYVCRKGFHAINVQAVCDAKLRFINTVIRWPGSCHDSMIFTNSSLGQYLEQGNVDGWLLGDSGYPCRPWVLTPINNPESKSEIKYNSAQCKTRNTVERAFGVLKSRFRCLHKSTGCIQFSPDKCNAVIMAAFKLHNFCIDNNLPDPPMILPEADNSTDYTVETDPADGVSIRRELIAKRFS